MSEVIRQRRMQANYLNCSNDGKTKAFALLGVGAKTLDENPSAQTKSRKYVCDKSATKSISGYDWNAAFDIDQIREQDAINFIVNIGENQLVGEDAETEYVVVDLDQKDAATDTSYHARKFNIAIEVASFTMMTAKWAAVETFLAKVTLLRVLLIHPLKHLLLNLLKEA